MGKWFIKNKKSRGILCLSSSTMSLRLICGLCLVIFLGCTIEPVMEEPSSVPGPPGFERVPVGEVPSFEDDLDSLSLRAAIKKSIDFYNRVPAERTYPLGEMQIRADVMKASLEYFLKLMEENRLDPTSIAQAFDVYRVEGGGNTGQALVTGYYEPILEGRLEYDNKFCYPLYGTPPDLVTIDLASFDAGRFSGERLAGRLKENRVVPYFSRSEIDGQKKLAQSGCELVWLNDPLDAFFLHIQGSGMIKLPDGRFQRVGFAGTNGRPYTSIGKFLLERGVMSSEEMSLQTIRAYLRAHPEVRDEILWRNESYVFFRWVEEGPLGSLNVPLTAGRSIATDTRYHPRGGLAFLETQKPRLDGKGEVTGWEPLHRWVVNQDTGGAIKGVGRVDLFFGSGEAAEWIAGRLKHPGRLYFLVKKEFN